MTSEEFEALVTELRAYATDHQAVEAKSAETALPQKLWQSLSAFANTRGGGVLILGISEESAFSVRGVRDTKKIMQDLASLCDNLAPPVRALITPHRFEGKNVVVAEIPEASLAQKPCYYKGAGLTNGAFIRVADGNRRLTPYEVQLMLSSRAQPKEDCEAVPDTSVSDLHPGLVDQFLKRLRGARPALAESSDNRILRLMSVTTELDGKSVLTLGGLLALGAAPQQHFPELGLTFVSYPGQHVGELGSRGERFTDEARVEGPIPLMIEPTLAILQRNMKRRSTVQGLGRENQWEYPITALREAIVNALVHRDLDTLARGTPVQVQLFRDRLDVVSPGGLHGPVTLEELGEAGISSSRNASLMRILEDTPVPNRGYLVCENRGSGIGAMLVALRNAGMSPPVFADNVATFRVTFPNHTLFDQETLRWLASVGGDSLTENQRVGLALLKNGEELSNEVYRKFNAVDSRVATRELKALVRLGLIEARSSGRWTTYRLAGQERSSTQTELPIDPIERRFISGGPAAVEQLLRNAGALSRADIGGRLDAPSSTTRYWLRKLIEAGKVERTTESPRDPAVKYRLVGEQGSA